MSIPLKIEGDNPEPMKIKDEEARSIDVDIHDVCLIPDWDTVYAENYHKL